MRSALTHLVFRRILQNEPILHRDCSRRASHLLLRNRTPLASYSQRRTLFGFFRPKPKRIKIGFEDPGLDILVDATKNLQQRNRVPEPEALAEAWTAFVSAKAKGTRNINDIQAGHVLRIYRYLCGLQAPGGDQEAPQLLSVQALDNTIVAMSGTKIYTDDHASLAKELLLAIKIRPNIPELPDDRIKEIEDWMVELLCRLGRLEEAWAVMQNGDEAPNPRAAQMVSLLHAYANVGDLDQISRLVDLNSRLHNHPSIPWLAAHAYAITGNVERAKELADSTKLCQTYSDIHSLSVPNIDSLVGPLLRFCAANDEVAWGQSIIRGITEGGLLSKHGELWDELFIWTLSTGKSVDEVDRMMEVMLRTNGMRPTISVINKLIEFANSTQDSYLAERLLGLASKLKIEPNAQTCLLQMDYRLSVGDIEGVRSAYRELQYQEVDDDEDLIRINQLVCAMCSSGKYDFNTIMSVVEDLSRQNKRFEPETVAALSVLHLQRDEYHDVADLLTTHVHQYSAMERARVRDTFVNFCLDRSNSIARVWDTYMIFQQVFDEADRNLRLRIMNEFFTRHRSDMAVHVFNHMRKHVREDTIPNTDTYAATLAGIAMLRDEESLKVVHNAIKIDMNIDPSTKLSNALMYAYASCGEPRYSTNFWLDICDSKEGPNHNSIIILFYACSLLSFGEKRAVSVWNRLERLDVALSRDLVAMFLAALTSNHCYTDAYGVAESCEDKFGVDVDAVMLGTMYNAIPRPSKQTECAKWIAEKYPGIMTDLEKVGKKTRRDGLVSYNVNVSIEP
ncbi:hypothetical protein EJ08DRAFT_622546 [Tothia fuscella]|uniref:Uncharacterized protein n=1 Tax=Tothia fuscella TaxID=1048955 RepID=A0A9P4NE02_9PEZI|nr:hypothetical protein EJ08DRAFT_622546 [Tothia fuscella]